MKLSPQVTDHLDQLQASLDTARSQGAEPAAMCSLTLANALRKVGEHQKGQQLCSEVADNPTLSISTRRMARAVSADIDVRCDRHRQARAVLLPLAAELSDASAPRLLLQVRRSLCKMAPRAEEKRAELQEIFEQQCALQGLADEDTQRTIHDLAYAMSACGREQEAIDWLTATIDALKPGASQEQLLSLSTLMVHLRQCLGDISGLEAVFLELLTQSEMMLGPGHPQSLRLQELMACAEIDCGDFDGAARRHQLLLKSYTEIFGPESIPVCWVLHSIAKWHELSGERHKAIPIWEDLLRISKDQHDNDPVLTRSFHAAHAISVGFMGESERSIALHRKLIRDEAALFGSDDPGVLFLKQNLGLIYFIEGRSEEASQLSLSLIQSHQNTHGERHRFTLSARVRHIDQQLEKIDIDDVLAEIQELASLLKSTLGPLHETTIISHQVYSRALAKDGQHKKATEIFIENVLHKTIELRSTKHMFVHNAYTNLIHMLMDRGRWNEALQQTIKLEQALSSIHATDSDVMLDTLELRAEIYEELKDYPKAELTVQRLYRARKNTLSPTHKLTISAVSQLMYIYLTQEEHESIAQLLGDLFEHDLSDTPAYEQLVTDYVSALIMCDRTPTASRFVRNELSRLAPDHPGHSKLQELQDRCNQAQRQHEAPSSASSWQRYLDWLRSLFIR